MAVNGALTSAPAGCVRDRVPGSYAAAPAGFVSLQHGLRTGAARPSAARPSSVTRLAAVAWVRVVTTNGISSAHLPGGLGRAAVGRRDLDADDRDEGPADRRERVRHRAARVAPHLQRSRAARGWRTLRNLVEGQVDGHRSTWIAAASGRG